MQNFNITLTFYDNLTNTSFLTFLTFVTNFICFLLLQIKK